ncbi:MAG: hypothetical protein II863_12390 [Kiritimatiellae bacterium]|nr:hypothetical protein [Kiritimatiellia bacterium]
MSAYAELNVVASETPYVVTAAPTGPRGYYNVARIRGVNADGTDVDNPVSVVLNGQGLYQIAPCGQAIGLTISGLTFANASSAAGTMSNAGSGSAIDLKEYGIALPTVKDHIRLIFEKLDVSNRAGAAALAIRRKMA